VYALEKLGKKSISFTGTSVGHHDGGSKGAAEARAEVCEGGVGQKGMEGGAAALQGGTKARWQELQRIRVHWAGCR
jgi:hypothetical protein